MGFRLLRKSHDCGFVCLMSGGGGRRPWYQLSKSLLLFLLLLARLPQLYSNHDVMLIEHGAIEICEFFLWQIILITDPLITIFTQSKVKPLNQNQTKQVWKFNNHVEHLPSKTTTVQGWIKRIKYWRRQNKWQVLWLVTGYRALRIEALIWSYRLFWAEAGRQSYINSVTKHAYTFKPVWIMSPLCAKKSLWSIVRNRKDPCFW